MKTWIAAFAAMTAFIAAAQTVYKWVDENGRTHYTDTPPPDGKGQKIDVRAPPPSAPVAPQPTFQEKEQAQRLLLALPAATVEYLCP